MDDVVEQVSADTGVDTQSSEQVESAEAAPQEDALKYEKGVSLSEKLAKNPNALNEAELADLDKLEKFKWNGKVMTAKELKAMAMMQSDYTKKTQAIAEQKKYQENLAFDLENVKNNPSLVDAFKRIYPKEYHRFIDFVVSNATGTEAKVQPAQGQAAEAPKVEAAKPEAEVKPDPRLEELYNHYQETQQQAATEKVNALFDRLNQKFPDADEGKIIAKVQSLIELSQRDNRYSRPTDKDIESMFKNEHEKYNSTLKERLSKMIAEQKKANVKGSAPLGGGGTPGQAPVMPRTIKEAGQLALSDPNFS